MAEAAIILSIIAALVFAGDFVKSGFTAFTAIGLAFFALGMAAFVLEITPAFD